MRTKLLLLLPVLLWATHLWLIPVFPSQDGPSHLLTSHTMMGCIQDQEPARSFYSWKARQGTNQLASWILGAFSEMGLQPRVAEALFHLLLLSLLLGFGSLLLARVEAAPEASLLLLLPFMGRILHLGYYNFLLGVILGIGAWVLRRPGWRNLASDLLFLFALYAHPLGAISFLGLTLWDFLRRRRTKDLPFLLPHLLLFLLLAHGTLGGRLLLTYDAAFPDFVGEQWRLGNGIAVKGLSLFLLSMMLLGFFRQWKHLDPASRKARLHLLLPALLLLLATGLAPNKTQYATDLRVRAGFLGWVLLLLALAPSRVHRRLPWIRSLIFLTTFLLVALGMQSDRSTSKKLQSYLDSLPHKLSRPTVLTGFNLYDPQTWLIQQGFHSNPHLPFHPRRLLQIQKDLPFNPWLHLLDRWALETHVLPLANHQSLYPHSPLRHHRPPDRSWRDLMEYNAGLVPLAQIQDAAAAILLANLDPDWLEHARSRLPKGLRVAQQGPDWILLESRKSLPPKKILQSPFYTNPCRRMPIPLFFSPKPGESRVQAPPVLAPILAGFPFIVYQIHSSKRTYRRPLPETLQPSRGQWSKKGDFRLANIARKRNLQFLIVPR